MVRKSVLCMAASGVLMGVVAGGCENLPGGKQTQGATIGGVAGAAAGALVAGDDNRLLGALIGGALGAGGGWLIGSELENADDGDRDRATKASEQAQRNPATAEQARRARTADINGDGYVTMDEVVALDKAGFSDDEIIERLERTEMFFDLSTRQQQYLRDNGVSDRVVREMNSVNPEIRAKAEQRLREKQGDTGGSSAGQRL